MQSELGRDRRDRRDSSRGRSRFGARAGALALASAALIVGLRSLAGCGGSPDDLFTNNPDFTATKNERLGRVLTTTGEGFAAPAYVAFADAASELETEAATFCQGPSADRFRTVQSAWRRTMSAWLFASVPVFGPIRDDNRSLRIEFWPDANNNVPRAVEQLLASGEPISADVLAGRSVAAQGLPALEQLLFDPEADPLGAFLDPATGGRRCDAIRAMSTNVAAIAADVATAWQPSRGDYAGQLARSGVEGGAFPTRGAAVEEVVNSMITLIERTKNDRLAKPLSLPGGENPVLARAESHRSRTSLANVARTLEALQALYLGGEGAETGFGFDDFLRLGTEASLDGRIQRLFESTIDSARSLPASFTDLLADPAAQSELATLFNELTELTGLLKNDLAEATGVVVGFNENDGD